MLLKLTKFIINLLPETTHNKTKSIILIALIYQLGVYKVQHNRNYRVVRKNQVGI